MYIDWTLYINKLETWGQFREVLQILKDRQTDGLTDSRTYRLTPDGLTGRRLTKGPYIQADMFNNVLQILQKLHSIMGPKLNSKPASE